MKSEFKIPTGHSTWKSRDQPNKIYKLQAQEIRDKT